jgi:hypothetical protein
MNEADEELTLQPRPYYDHRTRTHYIEVERAVYDHTNGPVAMLDISLFADSVSGDDWVWIECEDDARLTRVSGLAAVLVPGVEL